MNPVSRLARHTRQWDQQPEEVQRALQYHTEVRLALEDLYAASDLRGEKRELVLARVRLALSRATDALA